MRNDTRHRVGDGFPNIHFWLAVLDDRADEFMRDEGMGITVATLNPQWFGQTLKLDGLIEGPALRLSAKDAERAVWVYLLLDNGIRRTFRTAHDVGPLIPVEHAALRSLGRDIPAD